MRRRPDPNNYGDVYTHGFRWYDLVALRAGQTRGSKVLLIATDAGQEIEVRSSPKGNRLRVYRNGRELK